MFLEFYKIVLQYLIVSPILHSILWLVVWYLKYTERWGITFIKYTFWDILIRLVFSQLEVRRKDKEVDPYQSAPIIAQVVIDEPVSGNYYQKKGWKIIIFVMIFLDAGIFASTCLKPGFYIQELVRCQILELRGSSIWHLTNCDSTATPEYKNLV